MRRLLLIAIVMLLPLPSIAQGRVVYYLSGTGFFVNGDGAVVTNAHVVKNCRRISISGAVPEVLATLHARDEKLDLALLRTPAVPPAVAELRAANFPPEEGERVVTVGFPGRNGLTTREAVLTGARGPSGEAHWLQFTSTVAQGNSGGPLLDGSGKVLGVVKAKADIYRRQQDGQERFLRAADIAIHARALAGFLSNNGVRWREAPGSGGLQAHRVEDRAREFVVNVKCQLD